MTRSTVVSPRVSNLKLGDGGVGDEALGELHARFHARVRVAVIEEYGGEAADVGRALPADELVVVELGEFVKEAGLLGVLVDLGLPAVGDGRGEAGAVDDRRGAEKATCDLLGERVLGRVGAPLGHELLGVRGPRNSVFFIFTAEPIVCYPDYA